MNVVVVGKGQECPSEVWQAASEAGEVIALGGHVTITGGLGGVMTAACWGATRRKGTAIGIVPLEEPSPGNWPPDAMVIRTGLHHTTRNIITATACDAMVACRGGHGTLQEIAFALDRPVPVCSYRTRQWLTLPFPGVDYAEDAEELAAWLASLA